MEKELDKQILISATTAIVWKSITDVALMAGWMGDPSMNLEINTSWEVGAPIRIRGKHHALFENKGTVLEYLPEHTMSYDYLSSLSRLPDEKINYTTLQFVLTPQGTQTLLSLKITGFPTEVIYHHINFYWNGTLVVLKKTIEDRLG